MKKFMIICLCFMVVTATLLLSPKVTNAFQVTYLHPDYIAKDFLTLNFPTASIEFDADGNLYTEDANDWGSGEIRTAEILRLDRATDYSTSSVYTSYQTRGRGINGLDFDEVGSLFVSGFSPSLNFGRIREIDTSTLSVIDIIPLNDFRPTGVAADSLGNIYFPGRLRSNLDFGNIYKIDSSGVLSILVADFVGTGIAVDDFGNMFVSTYGRDGSTFQSRSIYMFDLATLTPSLFATFDEVVEELNFDSEGNLYALELHIATDTPKIIQLLHKTVVTIDIKPGSYPNSINLSSAGVIPVAIFSSDTFDATTVDPETVGLAGARIKMVGKSGKYLSHQEDVNGDGLMDLVCQVYTALFMIEPGNTVAVLEAETFDGIPIRGEDAVNIISN